MSTKLTLFLLGVANIIMVGAYYLLIEDPPLVISCFSSFAAGFCLSAAMWADE